MTDTSPEQKSAEHQATLCVQAFDVCPWFLIPKLYAARALNVDLLWPFRSCHRMWRDGAAAFRHDLVKLSCRWKGLGLAGSCPYAFPTPTELVNHRNEFQNFATAQQLKRGMVDFLDTAFNRGVPTDSWTGTEAANKEAYDVVAQSVRNAGRLHEQPMSEEDLRKIRLFDIAW